MGDNLMIHMGDITKILGYDVPSVDVAIGKFPLLWERLNGPGSCLWASEIEEFPIAVTRRRFCGEKEAGE